MVHIRPVELDDREGVVSCVHSASIANKRDYPDEFIDMMNERGYTFEWITKKIEDNAYFLVAVQDDAIIGTVSHRENEVINVFVHYDYQGQGIGKTLMQAIEDHLRDLGHTTAKLNANLTSVDFYKYLGYEVIQEVVEEIEGFEIRSFKLEKKLNY